MADILQWFNAVDVDRSGHITSLELQRALAMGGMNFSLTTAAQMIRVFDADKTGSITLPEFQALHMFLMEMYRAFGAFDRDRSGQLTRDEIHQALTHAGFNLDQHAFGAVFSAFDPDRSNSLGMAEFVAMTMFLRCCSGIFSGFDTQRVGRVNLDFSQFVYSAANCR